MKKSSTPDDGLPQNPQLMFEVLNEIGIISQLSRTLLESRLGDGLTQQHFGALNHLVRLGDGRTPLQMASAFQVPKTSMSHTLAGLEKRGLIRMEPNPDDGRGKLIFITEAGRCLRDTMVGNVTPDLLALIPQFGLEDASAVLPLLRKLRILLDEARTNAPER
jgi:DNA-binding MarR family transcriptional regulator